MDNKLHIIARFDIIPGHEDAVLAGFKRLAEESRKEPGCVSYILTQDTSNPQTYTVIECWASQKDFEAHIQAPHFKEFQKVAEGKRENQQTSKLKQII